MSEDTRLVDRVWLEEQYLPALEGRTLFVGTAPYTGGYAARCHGVREFTTVDLRGENAAYGTPGHHITGDVMGHFPERPYSNVALYGLWGQFHSVTNDLTTIQRIVEHCDAMLYPGGTLLLGPNWHEAIAPGTWEQFYANTPALRDYDVIEQRRIGNNYVWRGRKRMESGLRWFAGREVLVIAAHHDDESVWWGGLLTRIAQQVKHLCVCVVTAPAPGREDTATRALACGRVCTRLGAVYEEFRLADCGPAAESVDNEDAVRVAVRAALEIESPDIVITHNAGGEYGHAMHRLVNRLAQSACADHGTALMHRQTEDPLFIVQYDVQHKHDLLRCYEPQWSPLKEYDAYAPEAYGMVLP